jgi:hypothetical protein
MTKKWESKRHRSESCTKSSNVKFVPTIREQMQESVNYNGFICTRCSSMYTSASSLVGYLND